MTNELHQYHTGFSIHSGATELVHVPDWEPGLSTDSHAPVKFIRRGSVVSVSGFMLVTPNVIPAYDILTTLPEEFRPSGGAILEGWTIVGLGPSRVVFNLNTDGELFPTSALSNYFYLSQVYWVES